MRNPASDSYVYSIDNVFTQSECNDIIRKFNTDEQLRQGHIYAPNQEEQYSVRKEVRDCKYVDLFDEPEHEVLRNKLTELFAKANAEYYDYDLDLSIPIQVIFVKYEDGGHFGMHIDNLAEMWQRKISMSILLNRPEEFMGGMLHFPWESKLTENKQGTATFFPSYMPHKVIPVSHGTRYVLVAWALSNKAFR